MAKSKCRETGEESSVSHPIDNRFIFKWPIVNAIQDKTLEVEANDLIFIPRLSNASLYAAPHGFIEAA